MFDEYVLKCLSRKFAWGSLDCCCFAADWVREAREVDPMEKYRNNYTDRNSAIRLFSKAGGLEKAIATEMDRLGFARTDDPETGDLGIIIVPVGMRGGLPVMGPVAGLRYATRWLVLNTNGLVGGPFEARAAWRI
jgi:hypothetical protein